MRINFYNILVEKASKYFLFYLFSVFYSELFSQKRYLWSKIVHDHSVSLIKTLYVFLFNLGSSLDKDTGYNEVSSDKICTQYSEANC